VIFHIPHASRAIPPEERAALRLSEAALDQELLRMTDAFTDVLFAPQARADDVLVRFPVSRLVLDPERFDDDALEPMAERGMGMIYTCTHDLKLLREPPSPVERERLLARYYYPHHRRLREAVAAELDRDGQALVLDAHSFPSRPLPYEPDQRAERPDVCIGTDTFHTPQELIQALREAISADGLQVMINRPFAGALVPAPFYGTDARVRAVMIEINRRLYMDETNGERSPDFEWLQTRIGEWVMALRGA
jgi:N-formylglutamate amidohydrolase